MPRNWEAREKKVRQKRFGMKVSGKSVFVVQEAQEKRDKKTRESIRRPNDAQR